MTTTLRDELKKELLARGFSAALHAPNDTMAFDDRGWSPWVSRSFSR